MIDCVLKDWVEESLVKLLSFYSDGNTIYFSFLLIFKIHSLDIFLKREIIEQLTLIPITINIKSFCYLVCPDNIF